MKAACIPKQSDLTRKIKKEYNLRKEGKAPVQ